MLSGMHVAEGLRRQSHRFAQAHYQGQEELSGCCGHQVTRELLGLPPDGQA